MPRQATCAFCGHEIEPGTGLMYVRNSGAILWFCSRRCFTSYLKGRKPRRYKWARRRAA
ncbi:MAG: 50S ribosomal protein L24e [Desulfurococcaceae archaeon]